MAKVIKKINQNSMWIKARFPSGSSFKFTVLRYSKSVEMTFNSHIDPKPHMLRFMKWVEIHKATSYGNLFKKIETLSEGCNTMRNFMKLIN